MDMADTRDDPTFLILAQNLREQRKKKFLSQEQLADLAHLDRTYISLIETGKRNPSLSTISDLANILEIAIHDLLLEPTQQQTPIMRFCVEYSINPEFLVEILRDPKVIPMIRGKAFEFLVKDKLEQILQKSLYSISNPFLNPQSGTDKADVKIQREADEKVFLVGQINDLKNFWKHHHVLLLPSRFEGTPLALIESMLCGRSAVVTDVAGNTEWIDVENGFIAEAASVKYFEKALEDMWVHRDQLEILGKKCHQKTQLLFDKDIHKKIVDRLTRI